MWEIPLVWLWAAACLAGLTVRRSRFVVCLLVFVASVVLLLNTDNNDLVLYRGWYIEILYQPFSRDWLFDAMELFASRGGIPFEVFRTVLNASALTLYVVSIKRMSGGEMRPFPFACFLLMSLWLGTTLFRTFLAGSVASLAISFAFSEKATSKSIIWFGMLIVIAGSIHFVCYVFLLLLPAKYLSVKSCKLLFTVLTAVLAFLLVTGLAKTVLAMLIGEYRVDYYFALHLGLGCVVFIMCILSQAWLLDHAGRSLRERGDFAYGRVVSNIGLCFLPLCAISLCNVSESFRIIWVAFPVLAAIVDKWLRESVPIMQARIGNIGMTALWLLLAFTLAATVHNFDLSFVPVMLNNTFNEVFS